MKLTQETLDWISDNLSRLLGLPHSDAQQMAEQLSNGPESIEYLQGLLGEDSDALNFISAFAERTSKPAPPKQKSYANPAPTPKPAAKETTGTFKDPTRVYRKKDNNESYLVSAKLNSGTATPPQSHATQPSSANTSPKHDVPKKAAKQKKTYVVVTVDSLTAGDRVGNLVGLNGRPICQCLAAKHGLLTNCLTCGKVICSLEGPGPCPSCGSLVESAIQQVTMIQSKQNYHHAVAMPESPSASKNSKKSKASAPGNHVVNRYGASVGATASGAVSTPGGPRESEASFPTLASEKDLIALRKAEEQRERLLDYQKNSTARTRVFDSASDFDFNSDAQNKWLTAEERGLALKKAKEQEKLEEERKKARVISIDLQSRRVVLEKVESAASFRNRSYEEEVHISRENSPAFQEAPNAPGSTGLFQNPTLRIIPKFIPPTPLKQDSKEIDRTKKSKGQDKKAKSVEQPWIKEDSKLADKPATMKKLREILADEGQGTENVSPAKAQERAFAETAKKQEAEVRKYLKGPRRVQDNYDEDGVSFSVGDTGSAVGDEPVCG
ncbi:hypothetical protein BJ741DRAFT_626458 [Chytriomyces cf. hyalinus JEL632]|nr:hypothetical protein BJ741DRAFT_626458 [Chytriomyces cf. hyalinus JEL632]